MCCRGTLYIELVFVQEQNDVRISEGSSMISGTVYFAGDEVCHRLRLG